MLIIEHRLEDVLWRSVDRIVLVNDGRILADLRPDELLSGALLAETASASRSTSRLCGMRALPSRLKSTLLTLILSYWTMPTPQTAGLVQGRAAACPKPAPQPLLEVKGLSFGYNKGQRTLTNVSFTIGRGEMVSIVGRNGAGKSTLSKLICGLRRRTAVKFL